MNERQTIPSSAPIVIVGGGIVGCSIAYHLAKREGSNVVLLEKGELTSGSTWHAAGLVGQLRSSLNVTTMLSYSVDLYNKLEQETGQPTGWKAVGGLRLACSRDRMIELQKAATMARSFGLPMEILTPKEAHELFPVMSLEGVVGAAYLPTDGYTDPTMTTNALATAARKSGAQIFRQVNVTSVHVNDGKLTLLRTSHGDIQPDIVVNAAGMWAREFGYLAGVNVPLIPVQHQFMVSEPIADMPKDLPTMRDPDRLVYYKEEMGGLVMGGYEPNPIAWALDGIPKDFDQQLLDSNFDHFAQLADLAMQRTPVLKDVGVRKLINGPEAFTPDGRFIMGQAPELKNYYVAAGFNAHGIAAGGGVGRMMAEWILDKRPSLDLWDVDIRRFGGYQRNQTVIAKRTLELYGKHYTMGWPHEEHESSRQIRKSPLYETLKSQRAVFGSKHGWERPNWFATTEGPQKDVPSFGWPNWHETVGQEHRAIREKAVLIDQTSFSKFEITGKDSLAFLQKMAVNNIDQPVGSLIYTQLCNDRGGIEADLTFQRLGESHFYMVTGTAFGDHDVAWLRDHLNGSQDVHIREITEEKSVINLSGPLSRAVLQKVCPQDVSHDALAFAQVKEITIAGKSVLAARVTYVGELGWEIHLPIESAKHVYEALWEEGQTHGIQNAGYRAIESCRLEKGYRYWSADIGPDYTPYEAGLGFCVDLTKEQFIGKKALTQQKQQGVKRKLCCFTLEDKVPTYGKETIVHEGKVVGVVSSSGFGYTIGKVIALGYLNIEDIHEQGYEIEVVSQKVAATRHSKTVLYDPKRKRILC